MNAHEQHAAFKECFTLLPVFAAVAELRSFSAAARALAVSPSAVSQAIARLERELETVLLVRTTRSVNLTEAGARLLEQTRPALHAAADALSEIARTRAAPTGTFRLNVPRLAFRVAIHRVLAPYVRAQPGISLEVTIDDRNVDIVRDGFDAGVRLHEAVEKDMVSVRLTRPMRFVVVGSPEYLARRGRPKHPRELVEHACLPWRSPTSGEVYRWEFAGRGRTLELAVTGPLTSNDSDVLTAGARDGLGLTYVAELEVSELLERGELETVLDTFTPAYPGLYLYFPRSARRNPRLAAFIEVARQVLE